MAGSRKNRHADPEASAASAIAALVPRGARLTAALSGGLDSVVLLHVLARLAPELDYRLDALHVHHGLNPRADDWARFCAGLCEGLGLPLALARVRVDRAGGESLEERARDARYRAYAAHPCDFLVLAHHRDDQAETLLLRLLRGAGQRGLAAMPARRPLAPGGPLLLRPLLDLPRAALADYAASRQLRWVEDDSNANPAHARNFLRHRVIPGLEEHFPGAAETLARAAGHLGEAAGLLDDLAALDARGAVDGDSLDLARLRALDPARGRNLLRWFIRQGGGGAPAAARLAELHRQMLAAGPEARPVVAWPGWRAARYRDRVWLVPELDPAGEAPRPWRGEPELALAAGTVRFAAAQGEGLSAARCAGAGLVLGPRQAGDRLRIHPARPERSLKNLYQEAGLPPWERERRPVLRAGGRPLWVPGLGIAADWQARPGEAGWLPSWHPRGRSRG